MTPRTRENPPRGVPPPRWTVWFRVALPLAAALALTLSPLPHTARSGLSAARLAISQEEPGSAAQAVSRAAEALPWRADLWEQAGAWWLQAGEASQAAQALERAGLFGPLSTAGQAALAEAYQASGDLQRASQTWESLIQAGQADRSAYLSLAEIARAAGDWRHSGETLRRWLALDPRDAETAYQAGVALSLDDPQSGLALLLEAARLDPGYSSRVREMQGGLNSAGRQTEPAYGWVQAGRGYASAGEWPAARESFARAVELRPDYAEAWALLGESRQQLGENGFSELARAESLDPDSLLMHALFSLYWQRQASPDRAVAHLKDIIVLQPGNSTWQIEVANSYAAMGRLQDALKHYQNATDLEPEDAFAWQSLAAFSVAYDYDVPGIGLPAARQAVALSPRSPAALDSLGQALLKIGDQATAERFFVRALEWEETYAPALLHLGILYVQDGRLKQGRTALESAAQFGSGTPTADQAQHLLNSYFE